MIDVRLRRATQYYDQHHEPQDPVSNNPTTIDNAGAANQSCSIQVSFCGSYYGIKMGLGLVYQRTGGLFMVLAFQ